MSTTPRSRRRRPVKATVPAPAPAPTPAPPRKGPPPPTKPPYPFLARLVPPDLARKGYTYRHLGAVDFYHARGEVRFQGLKEMIMHTWPGDFIHSCVDIPDGPPDIILTPKWNAWLERHLRGFVNEEYAIRQGSKVVRFVGLTGCASASKTHSTALYAIAWWQVEPEESIVVLTSTTKDMIRSRVWSVVQHYASTAIDSQTGEPIELGHLVPSQMKLLPPGSKDPKHSISAYAVAHGETLKAIDNLKGLHAKRMLVVIDEANGTPEAIFNVLPNYLKGCMDLTIIVIGNPVSRLDPHGRALKPSDGWSLAMDEKVIEWRTEGVKEWELPPGLALRFDGRDSPNVVRRRTCYPYLYHYEDWLKAEKSREEHGGTFSYWSFSRGMWPADGMSNVIFTEQLFLRCEAIGTQFTFESERVTLAFLDVAFGGDGCILQFAELGNVAGRQVLQLTDWVDVPIDPSIASHDIDYQIARWVMQTCIVRKVKPECFGLDATGTGRGVGAILAAEWSPKIHYTTWGQAPTDRPSAQNDGRPGKEVYATFVTELWFAVRELLEAGQVKGFSRESIGEFCSRQYEMSGRKYKAETKDDMRQRLRYSPDHADAVVGVVEVARRLGLDIDGKVTQTAQKEWDRSARAISKLYDMDPAGATPNDNEGGWAEQEVHGDAVTVEVENVWD